MARHVFFSFHYQRDIWRVNQIRNSWVTQGNSTAGFWDDAKWEKVKKQGDNAIKSWINTQMEGSSVTVVLIGAETYNRKYVLYELERSYAENKGILGIYIHKLKNKDKQIDNKGHNPLDKVKVNYHTWSLPLSKIKSNDSYSQLYKTYNWDLDNGWKNIGNWIEHVARNVRD